jgi:anti-sigma factor RsiW
MSRDGHDSDHERAQELLAWWVNGTLDEGERREVEDHLEDCALCRRDEAHCRALAARVRAAEEVAPVPHPARPERLLARAARRSGRLRLPAGLLATPMPVRWALVAQTALVVVLIGALGWRSTGGSAAPQGAPIEVSGAPFRTLADPQPPPSRAASLRVVFAAGTPEQELRRIVLALGAEIVAGPTPLGAYTLALPTGAGADPLAVVLEDLRSLPAVRFAEPVRSGIERDGGQR